MADSPAMVSHSTPDDGRGIIFNPYGSRAYDSVIDGGDVYVQECGYTEIAEEPGDVFRVTAQFNK